MIAEVRLVDDGPPTVAVGASDFAFCNLAFERGE
jgi:hypothetical protein